MTTAYLDEEAAERALREKLVEEAYELLDAKDLGAVVGEIADIKEVIEALLQRLKASNQALNEQQTKKRRELGGGSHHSVLVEFSGRSYRLKEAANRLAKGSQTA